MTVRAIINSIPKDKFVHFAKGLLVFTAALIISNNVLIAFFSSVIASYFVEVYQKITKTGKFEYTDILADTIGGLIGVLIYCAPLVHSTLW